MFGRVKSGGIEYHRQMIDQLTVELAELRLDGSDENRSDIAAKNMQLRCYNKQFGDELLRSLRKPVVIMSPPSHAYGCYMMYVMGGCGSLIFCQWVYAKLSGRPIIYHAPEE